MKEYHKIQTVYVRDHKTKYKTVIEGKFANDEFTYLASNAWLFTEKINGTNIRVNWDLETVRFWGRTDNAQIPTFLFSTLQDMFPVSKFKEFYPETPITLYGEGYGNKIQKCGKDYLPDKTSFILFDVKINDIWLKREDVEDIANHLSIDTVPIVGAGTLFKAVDMVQVGFMSNVGNLIAEGLVMRPVAELLDRQGKRIITKIKYKDFERQ